MFEIEVKNQEDRLYFYKIRELAFTLFNSYVLSIHRIDVSARD